MKNGTGVLLDAVSVRFDAAVVTESPIEAAMLVGLLQETVYTAADVELSGRGIQGGSYRVFFLNRNGLTAMVVPQLKVDREKRRYRLDFGMVLETGKRRVYVALECDGQEFHSAPDDVMRDKARDRDLAALGWLTLRFPGGEIVKGRWTAAPLAWGCLASIARAWSEDALDVTVRLPGEARQ